MVTRGVEVEVGRILWESLLPVTDLDTVLSTVRGLDMDSEGLNVASSLEGGLAKTLARVPWRTLEDVGVEGSRCGVGPLPRQYSMGLNGSFFGASPHSSLETAGESGRGQQAGDQR